MTIAQVAADSGVSRSGLERWIQRDRVAAGQRPAGVRDERERIAALEKALRLKEEECEILRRARLMREAKRIHAANPTWGIGLSLMNSRLKTLV